MGANIQISPRDLNRLERNLKKMLNNSRTSVIEIVQSAGLIAETVAAQEAPVDTGRLRQSIRKESQNGGLTAKVSTNVKYAGYQNDGTNRGIKAKRFMEKGFKAGAEFAIRKIGQ